MNLHAQRRERLVQLFEKNSVQAMFVTSAENRAYLTGFTGSNGWLVVTPERSALVTDGRYWAQVGEQCPGLELLKFRNEDVWLGKVAVAWLKELGFHGPAGIEGRHLVTLDFQKLQTEIAEADVDVPLVALAEVVETLRETKSSDELEQLKGVARIADRAFRVALESFKAGIRERDFCLELEYQMQKPGARKPSFDSIVASGPNGAFPHAGVTDRVIENGELVTVDFGALCNGYNSDITRTIWVGGLSELEQRVYKTVREAQKLALQAIRPGKTGKEVDAAARDHIVAAGFGEAFSHGLGHGIGLAVHEGPSLRTTAEGKLEAGMVVTVEPGIYLPGQTGCRVEDTVIVTETGFEYVTRSPYQELGVTHPLESPGY